MAGDFNAHSAEWGSATDDVRGSLLSGFATVLDFTVCNMSSVPTYRRVIATLVIDVTFTRFASNRPLVSDWSVLAGRYTVSDHEYVAFTASKAEQCRQMNRRVRPRGWSIKKLSFDAINAHWEHAAASPALSQYAYAENHVEWLQNDLTQACDAAMPRRSAPRARRAVHWWSGSLRSYAGPPLQLAEPTSERDDE